MIIKKLYTTKETMLPYAYNMSPYENFFCPVHGPIPSVPFLIRPQPAGHWPGYAMIVRKLS